MDRETKIGAPGIPANRAGGGCLVFVLWQFVWYAAVLAVVLISLPGSSVGYAVCVIALAPVVFGLAGYIGMALVGLRDRTAGAWVVPTIINVAMVVGGTLGVGSDRVGRLVVMVVAFVSMSAGMWIRMRQQGGRSLTRTQIVGLAAPTVTVLALGVALSVANVGEFRITSDAVSPAILPNDIVLSHDLPRTIAPLSRGDVVVAKDPRSASGTIVRTVGAIGGQIVPSVESTRVAVVPSGQLWLSSSSGSDATDSVGFGPQPLSAVKGRVFAIVWPPSRIRLLTSR